MDNLYYRLIKKLLAESSKADCEGNGCECCEGEGCEECQPNEVDEMSTIGGDLLLVLSHLWALDRVAL